MTLPFVQISLLLAMVILFFIYAALDIFAWPLSKIAETIMQSMFAIILLLIDPKTLLKMYETKKETPDDKIPVVDKPVDK